VDGILPCPPVRWACPPVRRGAAPAHPWWALRMTAVFLCHPEGEARRIPCQLFGGFFADAQNDKNKIFRITKCYFFN